MLGTAPLWFDRKGLRVFAVYSHLRPILAGISKLTGERYPKDECNLFRLYNSSIKLGIRSSTSVRVSNSKRYTSSYFSVLKKLSIVALSYGLDRKSTRLN